jgi:dipeptidyl aminopeptidase/acylaminoacyl peptidase
MDARFGRSGAVVFTGSEPGHPTELSSLETPTAAPRRLTDFNAEVAGRTLGKVESPTWKTQDGFEADGVLTYPPDFARDKKYPLVLLIHGGPPPLTRSAGMKRREKSWQLLASLPKECR